jgi:hypothetical protein
MTANTKDTSKVSTLLATHPLLESPRKHMAIVVLCVFSGLGMVAGCSVCSLSLRWPSRQSTEGPDYIAIA